MMRLRTLFPKAAAAIGVAALCLAPARVAAQNVNQGRPYDVDAARDDARKVAPHSKDEAGKYWDEEVQQKIDAAAKRLGLTEDRIVVNVERYGNTSAASIPIALGEAVEEGRLRPGDRIVCVGFGAGLTWGAVALRWGQGPSEGTS